MPDNPSNPIRLDPTQPLPPQAKEFARTMGSLLDGRPKDEATVERAMQGMEGVFDLIAASLYSLASMLVGEGEQSVELVEAAVSNAEVSACCDPEEARVSSRRALVRAALELIARRDASALAAPQGLETASTCIEDDDLASAGVSRDDFERIVGGPDRGRFRTWLESLPTATRTVFVLRAVAAFPAAETAELLSAHGGAHAKGWTVEAVRELFRQALCSLASQLLHASMPGQP